MVLDTNVLISACWTPDGLEAETVERGLSGAFSICTSESVWAEYKELAGRKKFSSKAQTISQLLERLHKSSTNIAPTMKVHAATDEDDNRFLECAEAAAARYLVTGNLRDYPRTWKQTTVVNAREFLNCLSEDPNVPPVGV